MKGRDAQRESKPKENGRNWVAWEPFMCPLLEAVGYASLLLNRAFEDIYEITLSNFHSPRGAGPHCSVSLRIARTGNTMEAGDKAEQETKKGFWRRGRRKSKEGVRLRGERPSIPFLPSACSSSVRPSQNKRWLTNKDAALTGIVGAQLTETKEELERICMPFR